MVYNMILASMMAYLSITTALLLNESFEDSCKNFASQVHIPKVDIFFSEYLPTGYNVSFPEFPQSCIESQGSSPHQVMRADTCRIVVSINTSNASSTIVEAWLPADWNGRFLSGGNGGLSGCVQYVDLSYGSSSGFATISGNNGHNGSSAEPFYQHPDVLEDYVYRAIYAGATVGKQITETFYDKSISKSYFMGCSGGGRQGFKMAHSLPEVFDGIIAAAPAINFVNLINFGGWLSSLVGFSTESSDFIKEPLWQIIHEEVMNQCDGLDGAIDGIIEDTDLCHPRFEGLICAADASNTTDCLTGKQVATVRAIYDPFYGSDGTLLYPRLQPGTELTSYSTYFPGVPPLLTSEWFKYVVYNPDFDPKTLTRADYAVAASQDPFNISTFEPDFTNFQRRGGKLLTFHGQEDYIISSEISTWNYHRVAETMSLPPSDLDSFYRYFRVSGMGHCAPGSGAWNLGMYSLGSIDNALAQDPNDNVLARIVAWVEKDEPPEYIRGSSVGQLPGFKRRHCKYPARNVYVGPGPSTEESSWQCQ